MKLINLNPEYFIKYTADYSNNRFIYVVAEYCNVYGLKNWFNVHFVLIFYIYIKNGLLSDYIDTKPSLDLKKRIDWFEQMLLALKCLYDQQLVHNAIRT